MAINESQLQTWSNAPASAKIQFTHEQVRKALEQSDALRGRSYEVYLQGSYANSTNTRVDSDVDVVVQLSSTFNHDISKLSLDQQQLFHQTFPNATYHWADFRRDVISALNSYFGSASVKPGNKSIKLVGNESRVNADVVPCLQHRQYQSFATWNHNDFVEGMKFWTALETPSREIVNFPKVHIENGEDKNADHRTDTMCKGLVRVVKNIRRQLVERNNFDPKIAPSYFVECMIYNVPDNHFQNDFKSSLEYTHNFILRQCNPATLLTASHQHLLFGSEPWQWNQQDAATFFQAAENFYNSN